VFGNATTGRRPRANIFAPVSSRSRRNRAHPSLESRQIAHRNAPFIDSFAANGVRRRGEDRKTESSAIESFPKIARIVSRPASFLRWGCASSAKFRQAALSCSFASVSARTPRSARTTRARLMVRCRSRAARRTSAARVTGIVTLCRTDLPRAALLFVGTTSSYRECTRVVRMISCPARPSAMHRDEKPANRTLR